MAPLDSSHASPPTPSHAPPAPAAGGRAAWPRATAAAALVSSSCAAAAGVADGFTEQELVSWLALPRPPPSLLAAHMPTPDAAPGAALAPVDARRGEDGKGCPCRAGPLGPVAARAGTGPGAEGRWWSPGHWFSTPKHAGPPAALPPPPGPPAALPLPLSACACDGARGQLIPWPVGGMAAGLAALSCSWVRLGVAAAQAATACTPAPPPEAAACDVAAGLLVVAQAIAGCSRWALARLSACAAYAPPSSSMPQLSGVGLARGTIAALRSLQLLPLGQLRPLPACCPHVPPTATPAAAIPPGPRPLPCPPPGLLSHRPTPRPRPRPPLGAVPHEPALVSSACLPDCCC